MPVFLEILVPFYCPARRSYVNFDRRAGYLPT